MLALRSVIHRCAELQCISRIPDAAGLNYTHVTVLNSATECTRQAGGQAGIRIVTNTWDIKF